MRDVRVVYLAYLAVIVLGLVYFAVIGLAGR
ncbi:MAG: hypothetical protein AVDCRST_MAG66-703 [uncultured Pseudonocardia sp.]|uniref:Uncharacterized protein n=1 Tax=uncultured Pseudonocardia sp. TaxID=211455 RepID=A0A6J4NJ20_9PSEU|nr:MAG: hypothetical protein AVDCRST_MAG66-703 [uncultured Pseudonocardia sp.]